MFYDLNWFRVGFVLGAPIASVTIWLAVCFHLFFGVFALLVGTYAAGCIVVREWNLLQARLTATPNLTFEDMRRDFFFCCL